MSMKRAGTLAAVLSLGAAPASAQSLPKERSEVAYPGGHPPDDPKISLVKVAPAAALLPMP